MGIQINSLGAQLGFSLDTSVQIELKSITPPSINGGGAINISTHSSVGWMQKAPKTLKDLGDLSATVAYDTAFVAEVMAMCQVEQTLTITWKDGATLVFRGWLDAFNPSALSSEEDQPTADIVLIASNRDAAGAVSPPVFTPAA